LARGIGDTEACLAGRRPATTQKNQQADPDMRSQTSGYSVLQITLHWTVAALVLFQLLFGESMTAFVDAAADERQLPPSDQTMASAHYWVGLAILALVAIRLCVRLVAGAPASEPSTPRWMALASRMSHAAFYALLVAVPVTGLLAYYLWGWMGDVHAWAKPVFIVLIGIHAIAAVFHHFVLKDAVLRKMLVPAGTAAD
jgi:cytochrome b561